MQQQLQVLQQQPIKYAIQTNNGQQSYIATNAQIAQQFSSGQSVAISQPQQQLTASTLGAYLQTPQGQAYIHQYSTSNASMMSSNPSAVLQQPSQSQMYAQSLLTPGTHYVIASNGQTGTVLQGYQTSSGTQILIPSAAASNGSQLIGTQAVVPAAATVNTQLNQLVQLVLGNGQTITTTLANLQAMGLNASGSVSQQQYATYQFANASTYQTQLVTNSAGQVFAVTPQVIPGTSQAMIASTPQYIQLAAPSSVPLVSSVQGSQIQNQTLQPTVQQTTGTMTVQQGSSANGKNSDDEDSEKDSDDSCLHIHQETQVSLATSSSGNSSTPQPTVSSTTSNKPNLSCVNVSTKNSTPSQSGDFNPDRISVQSQTSSPASSSNGSAMEPESTTQNVNSLAITISNTDASIVDGVNLEEIKEFARQFKLRRISLGLTQTQVGLALSATEGPSYSQSAICRFEKLDITPKSAQKIKPVLEKWMEEAEERYKTGNHTLTDFIGTESNKKRKRRTSFTPAALDVLNTFFEKNTHPTGVEMTELAERLSYDREVVRVWFCNKRQALRNTIKRLEPASIVQTRCDSF
ncbi:POU domain: class 6: transcription factor 1-like protein [Leptotrombidium deliense]|uniref:POU domain protein n=1 Tax=Leptotrombidium deliense TaxID=299467 RepID=A0A443SPX7_9ACAR|nr:POU domain: class 6: transcription factor 1-like protein [Leptotrombidium deliense]